MFESFGRSWEITKLSFNVMMQDKELLVYPILAGIFSLIYGAILLFPTLITGFLAGRSSPIYLFFVFLTYLGVSFIATFFNVCVVYTAKSRFEGKNAKFAESISFAISKIHLIFMWSLVSAIVGVLLSILDSMAEKAQGPMRMILELLHGILGMAWAIGTIFVVPSMVYKNLGPFEAIQKSVATLKKTWGESLIRHFSMGAINFMLIVLGIILGVILLFLTLPLGLFAIITVISLTLIYILLVSIIFQVANSIYNTALYVYADTGKIPKGYSEKTLKDAFRKK